MPQFVLNRNYTLNSLFGHVITFKKGQPTHVPPPCVKEVVGIGAECADGPVDILGEEPKMQEQLSVQSRKENIMAAFKLLEEVNARESFTASGTPTKAALVRILGFDVEKREYEPLWVEHLGAKG